MSTFKLGAVALTILASLSLALAACGGNDTKPVAQIDKLTGKSTQVAFDKGFVKALGKLKLTPGTVGKAKFKKGGAAVSFPITAGNVKYYDPKSDVRPYVQGEIVHNGSGLSLKAGKTKVELTDFVIDPGTSELTGTVSANGKVAAKDALLFNLDGSTLKPLKTEKKQNAAVLTGTKVLLSAPAAKLLNTTFKTKALKGGFEIGVSTITVALPKMSKMPKKSKKSKKSK